MPDYIPSKRSELYLWLKNLSDQITTEAPKMGVPPRGCDGGQGAGR
jgi:hypothetical protein